MSPQIVSKSTKLLLCGGYDGHSARKECYEFSVESSTWSRLGDLPILKEKEENEEEDINKKKEERGGKMEKEKDKGEEEPLRSRWREDDGKEMTKKGEEEEEMIRTRKKSDVEEEEEDAWGLSEHQSIVVTATKSLYLIGGLVDTNFLHPQKIVKINLNKRDEGESDERGMKEG